MDRWRFWDHLTSSVVDASMPSQFVGPREAPSTAWKCATVWFFSGMRSDMPCLMLQAIECLWTHWTLIWPWCRLGSLSRRGHGKGKEKERESLSNWGPKGPFIGCNILTDLIISLHMSRSTTIPATIQGEWPMGLDSSDCGHNQHVFSCSVTREPEDSERRAGWSFCLSYFCN